MCVCIHGWVFNLSMRRAEMNNSKSYRKYLKGLKVYFKKNVICKLFYMSVIFSICKVAITIENFFFTIYVKSGLFSAWILMKHKRVSIIYLYIVTFLSKISLFRMHTARFVASTDVITRPWRSWSTALTGLSDSSSTDVSPMMLRRRRRRCRCLTRFLSASAFLAASQ